MVGIKIKDNSVLLGLSLIVSTNSLTDFYIPVVPPKTLSYLKQPMERRHQPVGDDQQGIIWSLPMPSNYGRGSSRKKSKRSLLDQVLVGRGKRWSIFQNIFTNGGETYSRQKVSFGEIYILPDIFLTDFNFQVQSLLAELLQGLTKSWPHV